MWIAVFFRRNKIWMEEFVLFIIFHKVNYHLHLFTKIFSQK